MIKLLYRSMLAAALLLAATNARAAGIWRSENGASATAGRFGLASDAPAAMTRLDCNETGRYSMTVSHGESETAPAAAEPLLVKSEPFAKILALEGIRFQVTSSNIGSVNTLQITPSGLEIDNSPIVRTIDGTISGAEVADLNADGSPEIYVYVNSAGSGSYGFLAAYSANRRKSLSPIYLPPLMENSPAAEGYMGHDEFAVMEGVLSRRFPVYRAGDSNARPTGGMRQIQYRLVPGEAGWRLQVDTIVDY